MGRKPCCDKEGLNRGAWSAEEDEALADYIQAHGEGKWRSVPVRAGLNRCGKSCRLRWLNYLRPDIKRGSISSDEDDLILRLHRLLGNRWSLIARRLPGRTDNEIKNYWHINLSKRITPEQLGRGDYSKLQKRVAMKWIPPLLDSDAANHQVKVVRPKAFKCTKVLIPSHDLATIPAGLECVRDQKLSSSVTQDHEKYYGLPLMDDLDTYMTNNEVLMPEVMKFNGDNENRLHEHEAMLESGWFSDPFPNIDEHLDLTALSNFLNSEDDQ